MYDFSPDGVLFTAPDGRILAANPAACEILGMPETQVRTRGRQGLADPDDARWTAMLAERERTGRMSGIARIIRGDGTRIEVEVSSRTFLDAVRRPRSCVVMRDVTGRVSLERELEESRARLSEAEQVARMGSWEWDLAADRMLPSDGLLRIYGLARREFEPTFEGALRRVYPDDRERVRTTLGRAIERRASFELEYRAVRSDGRVRIVENRGDVVVDDAGTPSRVVGVVQDVTEARLSREALKSAATDTELHPGRLPGPGLPAGANWGAGAPLSARQLEILRLIAGGLTNAAIAHRLFITEGTVKWHVRQILAKTGSANRAEAIARVLGERQPDPSGFRETDGG